jgi:Amt family ammonium transporter
MSFLKKFAGVAAAGALALAGSALAQDAPAVVPVMDKGDVAWMLTSTVLVLLMTIPGLALFYGGLVRTKNMLSVLTQITAIFCIGCLVWIFWAYSLAFDPSGGELIAGFVGGLSRAFLSGADMNSMAATFDAGFVIPEYVFICFQMTFAAITCGLVVGSLAERVKYSALIVFAVAWITVVYAPIAHMVWASGGILFQDGAFDFAGGTVVHINSGVAALVACLILGKRLGFRKEAMAPHSLTMTLIGAGLLWTGWFGFNVGSNLEADEATGLVMINTFVATAAAALSWQFGEWLFRGHPSLLGLASGAIAGLVVITPACGFVGPMGGVILGVIAGLVCFFACTGLKNMLGYDDALDVFGIHGVGGMLGAIGVAFFAAGSLGGIKTEDYDMMAQLMIQIKGVVITILWSGIGTAIIFLALKYTIGIRVKEDEEREGLDIASHGERAYNY